MSRQATTSESSSTSSTKASEGNRSPNNSGATTRPTPVRPTALRTEPTAWPSYIWTAGAIPRPNCLTRGHCSGGEGQNRRATTCLGPYWPRRVWWLAKDRDEPRPWNEKVPRPNWWYGNPRGKFYPREKQFRQRGGLPEPNELGRQQQPPLGAERWAPGKWTSPRTTNLARQGA